MSFPYESPRLSNPFVKDELLQNYLKRHLGDALYKKAEKELKRLGSRVVHELEDLAIRAESHPPQMKGGRIHVDSAWKKLHAIAAQEGLINLGYSQKWTPHHRLFQHAKIYLYHPSSAYASCPLAMTDGAVKLLQDLADSKTQKKTLPHLLSSQPRSFWTSGQWMTERAGGSDVGQSETVARFSRGTYRLYGEKFYTSAATSEIALTLARIEDESGRATPGAKGLSLFLLFLKDTSGKPNRLKFLKLKDKLGTRALPTAEVELKGIPGILLGNPGEGIKSITPLLNISRTHNCLAAVSTSRRMIDLARDYLSKRTTFGKHLSEHPLHLQTLMDLEVEFQAQFHLTFYVSRLLGEVESGQTSKTPLLRMLTPLAKLYTAKQAIEITSEALECFGGAGYMEDSRIATHYRDVQTLPIWEGTTNILSLDVLRSIHREKTLQPVLEDTRRRLTRITRLSLRPAIRNTIEALDQVARYGQDFLREKPEIQEAGARYFAISLARTLISSLLIEHADANDYEEKSRVVAARFAEKPLSIAHWTSRERILENHAILKSDSNSKNIAQTLNHESNATEAQASGPLS